MVAHADVIDAHFVTVPAREAPRRAEGTLKETETQAPRDIGLEVSQAYTAMDLQEWRQAEALSADTLTTAARPIRA